MSNCPTECGRTVAKGQLMCDQCWRLVPAPLRAEVNQEWRAYIQVVRARPATNFEQRIKRIRTLRTAQDRATHAAREQMILRELAHDRAG